jgi:hypothetical protein
MPRGFLGRALKTSRILPLAVALAAGPALFAGCTSSQIVAQQTTSTAVKSGYPKLSEGKGAGFQSKKVVNSTYHGRAPYICTPSGFGRTSGCFQRS